MSMLAARIVAPRRMEMVEVPQPDLPPDATGALVVRARFGAVCGSDLPKYYRELKPKKYPLPVGQPLHECIGTVVQSRSARLREGDAVLALPDASQGLAQAFVSHEGAAVPLPAGAVRSISSWLPLAVISAAPRPRIRLLPSCATIARSSRLSVVFTVPAR